jgi:hypothetical protein
VYTSQRLRRFTRQRHRRSCQSFVVHLRSDFVALCCSDIVAHVSPSLFTFAATSSLYVAADFVHLRSDFVSAYSGTMLFVETKCPDLLQHRLRASSRAMVRQTKFDNALKQILAADWHERRHLYGWMRRLS